MKEVVFGTVLILGTSTKRSMLVISILMALFNIVFIIQEHKVCSLVDFVAQMPIIVTALVLLLLGYGMRLKIIKLLSSRLGSQKTRTISQLGEV